MSLPAVGQVLKKVSLVACACLVALMLAEVALHLFRPQYYPVNPAAYEYDGEAAFRPRADTHAFRTTDYEQENKTNRLGTSNFQDSFHGYESFVFAVGDSYTQGTGLPADMSYPFQLDLTLNTDGQGLYVKQYAVVNLGVAGYGGEQSLVSLRRWAARAGRPAAILYLGCDNDLEDDLAFRSGDRHRIVIAGSPAWGRLTTPLRFLLERTHLGLAARAAYRQRVRDHMAEETRRRQGAASASVAELESSVFERLKAFADEQQTLLVVGWSDEGESYRWLKGWAERSGVAFADWAPRTNAVRAVMPTLPLDNRHSGGHHRGWTNRLLAEEFARQIRVRR